MHRSFYRRKDSTASPRYSRCPSFHPAQYSCNICRHSRGICGISAITTPVQTSNMEPRWPKQSRNRCGQIPLFSQRKGQFFWGGAAMRPLVKILWPPVLLKTTRMTRQDSCLRFTVTNKAGVNNILHPRRTSFCLSIRPNRATWRHPANTLEIYDESQRCVHAGVVWKHGVVHKTGST